MSASIRSIDSVTLRDHDVSTLHSQLWLTVEEEKPDPASHDKWTMSVSQVSENKSREYNLIVPQVLGYLCVTTVSCPILVQLCPTYMGLDVCKSTLTLLTDPTISNHNTLGPTLQMSLDLGTVAVLLGQHPCCSDRTLYFTSDL